MDWQHLNTGFKSGRFNMNFDLQLAEKPGKNVFLRFYRWNPYCISLGANQEYSSVDSLKAKNDGFDIVKRPTGGRAILHAEELTYSFIHPLSPEITPKQLYGEINLAIKKGLINYNSILQKIELENFQPHFPSFYKEAKSNLCFAVSAKSEINFEGKKLVGSAQRKIGNVVLQHGSVLCGSFHKRLVDYLTLSEKEKFEISSEINATTTELESILNAETDYNKLAYSLKLGFEEHFNVSFKSTEYNELAA